jgi:hypothetical protein
VASVFSTISLAEISKVSLYSLPIFLYEVGNSGWYIHVAKVSASGGGIRVTDSMIFFSVKTLRRRIEVSVAPAETVLDLKIRIQDKEGLPPDDIVLVYTAPGAPGGKFVRLEDSRTIGFYNLESNPQATIEVLFSAWGERGSNRRPRVAQVGEGGWANVNSMERFNGG